MQNSITIIKMLLNTYSRYRCRYLSIISKELNTNAKLYNKSNNNSNIKNNSNKLKNNNNNNKSNNNKSNNNNIDINYDNNGVPYRRLAFSSKCYYNNNNNFNSNNNNDKYFNDQYIQSFNNLFKNKNDEKNITLTPIDMIEKCLAINDVNSLIYILSTSSSLLPNNFILNDKISKRIIRLLSSKGPAVFVKLLEILRENKLTLTRTDANSIITHKIKDKKMVDAFSILTIAEDKGLNIADSIYIDIAMDLLDEKIGFDSNSFFYILSVLKNKNIRLPIVLKEKMILSCKMFPILRWQHARKFITEFYKDYDLPITRTDIRLVRVALETMIESGKVEEALETWIDLSLYKKDKNHETNYEVFTLLDNVDMASLLGKAAIILNEKEIISFLFKSKALSLGNDDDDDYNIINDNDINNVTFNKYIEDVLLGERMSLSSSSSPSATVLVGLGLGWLISINELNTARRIWNNSIIMRMEKRDEILQIIIDSFLYCKNEQDIPPSVTIKDLKKVSSFLSDIIKGPTISDMKFSNKLADDCINLFYLIGEKDGAVAVIMRSLEHSIEVSDTSFIRVCQMLNNIEEYDSVIELYKTRDIDTATPNTTRKISRSVVLAKLYSPLMIAFKNLGLIDDMKKLFNDITDKGLSPTFPLYIIMMEGFNSIGKPEESIQFIINQPKPKDLIANRIIGDKIPNSYTAILTSALHSVSIASSVSSDDIISILQKYCIGQLNTLQLQFIMTNMRKSPPSESDIRKVLIYITNPIVLPTYLTSNILMDMLLLSMICKDESLIRLCINLIIESGKTFTLHHVAKHKGLGNIKIDNDLLQFIRKFDDENNKLISKAIKSEDFNELL